MSNSIPSDLYAAVERQLTLACIRMHHAALDPDTPVGQVGQADSCPVARHVNGLPELAGLIDPAKGIDATVTHTNTAIAGLALRTSYWRHPADVRAYIAWVDLHEREETITAGESVTWIDAYLAAVAASKEARYA